MCKLWLFPYRDILMINVLQSKVVHFQKVELFANLVKKDPARWFDLKI